MHARHHGPTGTPDTALRPGVPTIVPGIDATDMQPAIVLAESEDPSLPLPRSHPAMELLGRWMDLSELDRRAFVALAHELTLSSDLIENSTIDLSERFQALATIAQAQMGRVDTIIEVVKSVEVAGEHMPLEEALHNVEGVLRKVIDTILSVSKHAMRMVYALEDVARDVDGAEQCTVQIEAINKQTRYLALNAAIEASRSGEAGAAFGVIAREMKDLSRLTEETSREVRSRISSVTRGVRNGHAVLQEIATLDMSEHIMAKERLDSLIAGIIAQNDAFSSVLSDTAASSARMAETIGQLITGMQYQDRTKQHLSHVIDALDVLEKSSLALQDMTDTQMPGSFARGVIDAAVLMQMVENQTLGSVKQRILAQLLNPSDPAETAEAAAPADDIELF
jgi:methyl-accepting chemotaxis protein